MSKNAKIFWWLMIVIGVVLAAMLKADEHVISGQIEGYIPGPGIILETNSEGVVTISAQSHKPTAEEYAKWRVARMREEGSVEDILKILLSEGEVCKIKGHVWDTELMRGGVVSIDAVNYGYDGPRSSSRKCIICGATQTKTESAWH